MSALAVLVLTGCSADDAPSTDAERSSSSGPPTVAASVSSSPAVSQQPLVEPVEPNPPATYDPGWPEATVRNADGYLVNRCVPKRLRDHAIALTDSDGVRLSGLVLGSGPDGILLSHEQGYSVCSFLDLGERLAAEGYQVLLPEYRNHGASEKVADNEHLGRDAAAGLAELRRRGATRIFVGGASCGGTASIMVGKDVPDLVGLLIMSSPARCGLMDAVPAVARITAPSLFIVSPGDMLGAVEEQVRELYAASGSPTKTLVIDDSGYHGTDMFRESDHGDRLESRVLEFVLGTFG